MNGINQPKPMAIPMPAPVPVASPAPMPVAIPQRTYLLIDKVGERFTKEVVIDAEPLDDQRFIVACHPVTGLWAVYLDVVGSKFSRNGAPDKATALKEWTRYVQSETPAKIDKYVRMHWDVHNIGLTRAHNAPKL